MFLVTLIVKFCRPNQGSNTMGLLNEERTMVERSLGRLLYIDQTKVRIQEQTMVGGTWGVYSEMNKPNTKHHWGVKRRTNHSGENSGVFIVYRAN